MDKLTLVEGDLQKLDLGMSPIMRQEIIENIEVVFHAAADVRFDESLKESIETNVRGTRDILMLAEEIKHLKVFVYVSTAFANCIRPNVDEKFYRTHIDPDFMINMVESLQPKDFENFQVLANLIIKPYPNTYTYTKALAEQIFVKKYGHSNLPIAIIRPSIGM